MMDLFTGYAIGVEFRQVKEQRIELNEYDLIPRWKGGRSLHLNDESAW